MDFKKNMILRAVGMPMVTPQIRETVDYLFARWEQEIKSEKPYLLMMTTSMGSSFIELLDDDKENLSDLAIKLTGGHQSNVSQKGYYFYYPQNADYEGYISFEYSGIVEYKLQLPENELEVEYLSEKLRKYLLMCSTWYLQKKYNEDLMVAIMLTNKKKVSMIKSNVPSFQLFAEPLVFSYQLTKSNNLTDLKIKSKIMRELKGAFNIE